MEEDEGGIRLSKRFSDKDGEVDYKTKAGTAWSHSYLNQKPWHPLSYPNQRRKWIAEQTHSQRQRRAEEIAREYAQEQDFLRQTSLLSQKEKEKVDMMQAVSFMYIRPPGYNAESAKAAEISDERKKRGESDPTLATSSSVPQEVAPVKEEKKKPRPKDVFGRSLPTEEEFEVLKNAPRLETGVIGRVKPFAVEVRNVKCVRCGNFGHQSGDRECPLKDAIMPNDENRLKRDDPLTAIVAHMDSSEPLKWEIKQRPGMSPPRGGFMPDDPNQQIVAEEIFDEYGGFLSGEGMPELLTNLSSAKHKMKKSKSKSKHKKRPSSRKSHDDNHSSSGSDDDRRISKTKVKTKSKYKKQRSPELTVEDTDTSSENDRHQRRSRRKYHLYKKSKKKKDSSHSSTSDDSEGERHTRKKRPCSFENFSAYDSDRRRRSAKESLKEELMHKGKRKKEVSYSSSEDSENGGSHKKSRYKHSCQTKHHNIDKFRKNCSRSHREARTPYKDDGERKSTREEKKYRNGKKTQDDFGFSSEYSAYERHWDGRKHKRPSENSDSDDHSRCRQHR